VLLLFRLLAIANYTLEEKTTDDESEQKQQSL